MSLSTIEFGDFELRVIHTGEFRLDGGAMFGVVPKTLWNRVMECDDKNRIPMAMRCLLITSKKTGRRYLVDNGMGDKFDPKYQTIYGYDTSRFSLEASFKEHHLHFDDVTDIVFTHLHFDHCGGSTRWNAEHKPELVFPHVNYWVTKEQWQNAIKPNKRETASFFPENLYPLEQSGKLNLVEGSHEYEPGFSTFIVNGHSRGQQLPVLNSGDKTLVFGGDLLPTHVHVPLPWVMGYDMAPMQTLEEKEHFLHEAYSKKWGIFLEHDAGCEVMMLEKEGEKFTAKPFDSLQHWLS